MFRFLFLATLFLLLAAGGVLLYLNQDKAYTSPPAFSNYVENNPALIEKAGEGLLYPFYPTELTNAFRQYPTKKLNDEMKRLLELSPQRNPESQAIFEKEYADIRDIVVGDNKTLYDYIGRLQKPLTYEIYKSFSHDLQIIVAQEKLRHNVARPMHINLAINSPIETPDTPTYPSMFAARVMLVDSILRKFLSEEEYKPLSQALQAAINRAEVFGISTKFDTEYGSTLARGYTESVFGNFLSEEFVQTVREKEWSGNSNWPPQIDYDTQLPDILVYNPQIQQDKTVQFFKTDITNQSTASSPKTIDLTLEIDQFSDGVIDKRIKIPYGPVSPGSTREAGYTLSFLTPGTHSFRFVVNPDYTFLETNHRNNYGEWTEFAVGE